MKNTNFAVLLSCEQVRVLQPLHLPYRVEEADVMSFGEFVRVAVQMLPAYLVTGTVEVRNGQKKPDSFFSRIQV